VILERIEDARRRGMRPLVHILGVGESSDAHHLTQPHPQGEGACRAMQTALCDAGINAQQIDMIAAHATATPNNDAAEFSAYRQVFGDALPQIPVAAFKSHLGHTLGGAGAAELILSMLAIQNQCVPPTANVARNSIEFAGLQIQDHAKPISLKQSMNVSMGFGGANACVILGRDAADRAPIAARQPNDSSRDVIITGIGIVAPGCIGNQAFLERINGSGERSPLTGGIDDAQIEHLISARRVRRMSEFSKLMLAASTIAINDAGIDDVEVFAAGCNAIIGSTHGAIDFSEKYYRQIVEQGIDSANPMLFAEGVPNVGSAQLSLMLKLQGSTQTIVGSRAAGLEALCLAMWRIQSGTWERAIVGAAEEAHWLIDLAYAQCTADTNAKPIISSSGSVALVLESRAEVERRNRRGRGIVCNGRGGRFIKRSTRNQIDFTRKLNRELDITNSDDSPAMVDDLLRGSFSVAPLAKVIALLLRGNTGTRQHITGHDDNGFASGLAIEVL
jgi:3-oxoacyl-[acyl-carrier-protein] synthase II